jgi:hypothetical protein
VLVLSTVAVIALIVGGLCAIGPRASKGCSSLTNDASTMRSIASRLDVYWTRGSRELHPRLPREIGNARQTVSAPPALSWTRCVIARR